MKKYLIRAGISPLDIFDPVKMIMSNSIGGNVGNLIYQYSVIRNLMTENVELVPDYYDYDPKRAEEINENYDAYIIPLADAFRQEFVPSLKKYTQLIKKLNIPVIVIGVGLRAPFEPKLNEGFPFDKDVKAFVSAVLEKSKIIGVRGQITADYLSRLGFKEGTDHTVIGCPSMYAFGGELEIRNTNITKDSMICVNSSRLSPDNVLNFIDRGLKEFPNHYFIPQWLKEFILTYVGAPNVSNNDIKNYPNKMSDSIYMNDRVRFFLNVPTWLDFLKQADFSFGARLHGNIAAVLAGTPSIIIPKDARMRELAEYHNLTRIMANEIDEKTNLIDLIENADFQSVTKNQRVNFDKFIQFLNQNELEHIYGDNSSVKIDKAPLDKALEKVELLAPVQTIRGCTPEEMVNRFEKYYPKAEAKNQSKIDGKNDEIKKLKKTVNSQQKLIKEQSKTLNRRSVKMAMKVANIIR
ncbi:putative polysaccharide pyruvyl transferase [Bacillus sp. TS-2]|nr:putative polysaccharide pyruvyl transferase [Bacillus sp. TS-2]